MGNTESAFRSAVIPALALLPPHLDSLKARVALLAIGYQESKFRARRQMGGGPARGAWQMERGGGVAGVCRHSASTELARLICHERDCRFEPRAIWAQLEHDDILAAAFARLLLLTDPRPLPAVGDEVGCWLLYIRTWQPGKPRLEGWPTAYSVALRLATSGLPG